MPSLIIMYSSPNVTLLLMMHISRRKNIWGDHLWGSVNGIGKNWLGRILMQVRAELKEAL